jgi:chromosome segregation ATPase
MTQSARVSSIDALKALHAALARFGPEAQEALGAAEIEIRRVSDYLHDQLQHWQRRVERCQEDVNRARADLAHARALRQGERTGYVEQEIALRKAQTRLREAEEKVVTVRRWLVHLPQAINQYEGPARRLAGLLDADLKQGLAILEHKIAALEAYVALDAPAAPPAMASETPPQPPQGGPS